MSVTLIVVAEGATERRFVLEVLRPHLRPLNVHADPHEVNKRIRHDVGSHPGGVIDMEVVCRDIRALLRAYPRGHFRFTTMLDLYALPPNAPGYVEAQRCPDLYQRAATLERALADRVADGRFVPYLQLHEYEALLFADLSPLRAAFADLYADAQGRFERLVQQVAPYHTPEHVNEGLDTHPAARIIAEFPAYAKRKSFVGPAVAAAIGLPRLREACPHFGEWVTRLERLGQQ